ncbi:MAG: hypothetical protein D3915_09755 [Candidatus Electrothrix sp. AU1_5]|nr:hypothetical protein [Candidatus Electrothrix gigas]
MGLSQRKLFAKDEYLLLEENADTKHELVNGEIYAMAGAKEKQEIEEGYTGEQERMGDGNIAR